MGTGPKTLPGRTGTRSQASPRETILRWLENIVRKVKALCSDDPDLSFLVLPPHSPGGPYWIEVMKGRVSRRIAVEALTIQRRDQATTNATLVREIRRVMTTVTRLSQGHE